MFGTAGASLAALLGVSYLNRDVVGSFGLYSDLDQNKVINPTTEHFKVIDGTIPGIGYRNASTFFHFNSSLSAWEVAAVDIWAPGYVGTVTPKAFGNVFGFYFSGAQNPNSFFYTDAFYNGGIEYVSIDYTPYVASIRFDFGNNGTIDAIINTTDVAPVPEPATMLLLGTGLVGLAGTTRKRMKKA
ncbi:MAG: PEP-CTERM sorting domain-containing protein [Proteobacteria bacterium]|nr:PEP-CTERM sorting domain-containing protein [Desulfobulbaceae bacterium]MBU4153885.1 PEP-CTERM sorting domain-containing protein [Pseudomonadota bacterium]